MLRLIKRNVQAEDLKNGVSEELLKDVLTEHLQKMPGFDKMDAYYKGKHRILKRETKGDGRRGNLSAMDISF